MLVRARKMSDAPRTSIICDYRLRGEENGIGVIPQLQAGVSEAIPAMLITGDTAADRLVGGAVRADNSCSTSRSLTIDFAQRS